MAVTTTEVNCHDGKWKVMINDHDECCIVDPLERCRYRGNSHAMTGVHFAMQLSHQGFCSPPNLDSVLRMAAERFERGDDEEDGAS